MYKIKTPNDVACADCTNGSLFIYYKLKKDVIALIQVYVPTQEQVILGIILFVTLHGKTK